MGNSPSVRSTHFQRPDSGQVKTDDDPADPSQVINISNKMVERLVEDNVIYKDGITKPKNDYQEKICLEKLKCMDDSHSERHGLTIEDLTELIERIEAKTAKITKIQPVCENCRIQIIACYAKNDNDLTMCNGEIARFTKCVMDQTSIKLRDRITDMEDEEVRKFKDLEKARKYSFWGNLEPEKQAV